MADQYIGDAATVSPILGTELLETDDLTVTGKITINALVAFATATLLAASNVFSPVQTIGSNASTTTVLRINGAAASRRDIRFQTAGVDRWSTRAGLGAESGSNAGSNWIVEAFDDAGVAIDSPITIARAAAGAITFIRPLVDSVSPAASASAMALTGTVFTGGSTTTNKPHLLIEPAGTLSNNWGINGTLVGLNAVAGYTGEFINAQVAGVLVHRVQANGNSFTSGTVTVGSLTSQGSNSLSFTSVASTPNTQIGGTWFTGGTATSTKPHFLIEPSAITSTGWNTGGTGLGVNAASGFVGNLEDLQLNGVSKYSVDSTGKLTFAGNLIGSFTSVVSVPAATFTGTWFSGGSATTTKPHFLIETTGATSTGWSTAGTGLGVNAASGFTGNLADFQLNGVSAVKIDSTGKTTVAGQLVAALNGSGNVPGAYVSGTWHNGGTGTSTKPQLWVESSGAASSNAWNTSGTGLGVNAISGFSAGNLIDLQVNAVSRFSVAGSGLVTGGTVTRLSLAYTGVVSTSAILTSGTWFSGGTTTTTKPHVLVEGPAATSTAWSVGGTGIGVNAVSGFGGNLLDLQRNGVSQCLINQNGSIISIGVLQLTAAGIASFATIRTSGIWFSGGTGTSTKPHVHIESGAATSTNWQTTGTGLGLNAASGFVGYLTDMQLNGVSKFAVDYTGTIVLGDAANITVNATTGTKIATATSQKLGFWNVTPVIQPAGANQAAITDSTTGTPGFTLNDVGVVFSQSAINNNFASLNRQVDAFRTALVASGMLKGAA